MPNELHARTFNIPLSSAKSIAFRIAEPTLRAQGLSLQTWTSSFLLARLLHTLDDVPLPSIATGGVIPILELGAGTGLVGLTAAKVWDLPVVLTDLGPIVPGLAHNIALNNAILGETSVSCGSLDWKEPDKLNLFTNGGYSRPSAGHPKANLILAADTVYSEEHPELLSKTILKWLMPGKDSRAIIMYPMRVAYLDQIRELWQLLEDGGLEAIREGREQADEQDATWDDELLCEWSIWKWNDRTSSPEHNQKLP
jgi:predicted nicotinamide N-methyase